MDMNKEQEITSKLEPVMRREQGVAMTAVLSHDPSFNPTFAPRAVVHWGAF